jgi:hypothetical protein
MLRWLQYSFVFNNTMGMCHIKVVAITSVSIISTLKFWHNVTESMWEVFNRAWCVYASQIGLTDIFTQQANLSGISEQPLRVSKVVQKAHIEVDEEGATAAAATGIVACCI